MMKRIMLGALVVALVGIAGFIMTVDASTFKEQLKSVDEKTAADQKVIDSLDYSKSSGGVKKKGK